MKALIMAGGKGTRLFPYSATLPKPLVPIGDKPVLELLIEKLARAKIEHAVLGVNHLRHLIEAYFGDGSRFGLKISYSLEAEPLGTAGPIGAVLDELGETFIVTNGDLLTTLDIAALVEKHHASGAVATIGSYRRELKSDFGILQVDEQNRLIVYQEKPTYSHLISMGIYVLNRSAVRAHLRPGEHMDMPELLGALLAAGGHVQCYQADCYWLDIGRPEDLATAQRVVEENATFFDGT